MRLLYQKNIPADIDRKITKPFLKKALSAIFPVALQSLIEVSIGIIDTLLVGNTTDAGANVQAVGSANAIFYVYFSILIGLLNGTGIFVTQFFGAKKFKEMRYVIRYRIFILICYYFFYLLIVFFGTNFIINLTLHHNASNDVIEKTKNYLYLNSIAYGFFALSFAIHWTLRDTKRFNIPFYVSIWNLIFKIALALPLVYVFNLGIKGINYSNIIVRMFEFFLLIAIINYKKFEFNYRLWNIFGFTKKTFIDVNTKTWIFIFNELLWSTSFILQIYAFTLIPTTNGEIIQSIQVSFTMIDLAFATIFGISGGISALVGIKLGENNLKEALSNSLKLNRISLYISSIMGLTLILFSPFISFVLFKNLSYDVKMNIIWLIIIDGTILPLFAVTYCHFFTIRVGGDTKSILWMDGFYSIFVVTIINLGLCYLRKQGIINLDFVYIYLIVYIIISLKVVITSIMYYKKRWLKNLTNVSY